MRAKRRSAQLLAIVLGLSLFAAACGDDDDGGDNATEDTTSEQGGGSGGEFVDLGTFLGDPPEHIDPALNVTVDAYQVVNALYDGLTDIDSSDPDNPEIKPHVAESFSPNEDASVWTFKIREGMHFSDGEEILPSTFQASWERASDPDFAGDYSYLMNFIEGGAEKLDGTAPTLAGVAADDEAMTLTVTLSAPYSNFPAVAGFQLFFPVPEAALESPADWENGMMVGNGPYKLAEARTDDEIVLVRNDEWTGDINGETWPDRLDKITFRVTKDPDTSYNAFEAGEGDDANLPPGRVSEAQSNWSTTLDTQILGSYHFVFDERKPLVGGPENQKFREAISMAIDREDINESVNEGSRTISTGVTPPGIPGFEEGLCEFCSFDPDGAKAALAEWKAAGNTQSEPITIQFPVDNGHEPVVAIMVDNLKAVGIDAKADPLEAETYFTQLSDGACVLCRAGWYADYPTYDNFMYDLFHSDSIGGNNYGYSNEKFDGLVEEAKKTVDPDEQANLFQQAEQVLLNEDTGVVPIYWYRGDYVYDGDKVTNFPQTNFGLILWEQVTLAG